MTRASRDRRDEPTRRFLELRTPIEYFDWIFIVATAGHALVSHTLVYLHISILAVLPCAKDNYLSFGVIVFAPRRLFLITTDASAPP